MFNHQRHSGKLLITCIILFIFMLSFFIAFLVEKNKSHPTKIEEKITSDCQALEEDFTVCRTPECEESAKFMSASLNIATKPCDDFYEYACGNWIRDNPIPEGEQQVGITENIGKKIGEKLKVLLNQPTLTTTDAADKAKILYKSCIHEGTTVQQNAMKEIKGFLEQLGGWPLIMDKWSDGEKWKWWEAVATVKKYMGKDIILGTAVKPNPVNTTKYILYLQMPSPDELKVGPTSMPHLGLTATEKLEVYTATELHIMKIVCHFNNSTSICDSESTKAEIKEILKLEKELQLAQQMSLKMNLMPKGVVLGDKVFHSPMVFRADHEDISSYIMKVKDMQERIKGVDWEKFLTLILTDSEINATSEFDVLAATLYLQKVVEIINSTRYSNKTVANYICWRVVLNLKPYSAASFKTTQLDNVQMISGTKEESKSADLCVHLATSTMGFAVTNLYATSHISPDDIAYAMNLITHIRDGFIYTVTENEWLDKTTKERAIKKLEMMEENVAFPVWNNDTKLVNEYYQKLPVFSEKEFLKNAVSAMRVNSLNEFSKLKVDVLVDRKNDWPINNPMVTNAFYSPNFNAFYLVAGIMDLPIFSKNSLKSLNHGGIGYIIGHEVMHGFDDTGSEFDELGQYKDWWSPQAKDRFSQRASCMKSQYSIPLEQIPSLNINGELTLGENIADNGGIKGSYWGYKAAVKEDTRLPGLEYISGDKLFFISAAQFWCTNTRNETAEASLETDSHSPAKYRVNIPFGNSVEFLKTFKCNENTKMNIKKKCVIF